MNILQNHADAVRLVHKLHEENDRMRQALQQIAHTKRNPMAPRTDADTFQRVARDVLRIVANTERTTND